MDLLKRDPLFAISTIDSLDMCVKKDMQLIVLECSALYSTSSTSLREEQKKHESYKSIQHLDGVIIKTLPLL